MDLPLWLGPLLGFLGGVALGLAARVGRFCTLGAIEDAVFGAGTLRLRLWGMAIAVAVATVFALDALGAVRAGETFYLANPVPLLSTILGGLAFGVGMALVGTCGYGALARLGGGDLSGLVVFLVIGITGYIASSGALALPRILLFPPRATAPEQSGIAHALSALTGAPAWIAGLGLALALALICLRRERRLLWAPVIGLTIAAGWAVTSWMQQASFGETPVRSYSFVRPLGDTMIYAMTSSGTAISFGVAGVFGVIAGAALGALARREFRWEACDDAQTLKRQIVGASLMGIGGVFAMGCTVGQGLSAASVLAISAPVALASMFAGAWCGLQWLVRGSVWEPMRELLRL